jgi:hypothetical protein
MKYLVLLVVIVFTLNAKAQIKECKRANTFHKIQVYDNIVATIERGEEEQLCPGTDTKLEDLQITIADGVLRIRKIAGRKYEKQPRIRIIYTLVNQIEGYGKADMDTRNLVLSDSLTIILKSGSRFYIECDVKYLSATVIEGSLLKIDGYAVTQKVVATGKATYSGFELEGKMAEVKANTNGTIKLNIEKEISGSASTGGYITYKENPKTNVKSSLAGKIVASD